MIEANKNLWERLPGEPNLWWTRFESYRLIGPKRTLLAQYRLDRERRGVPGKATAAPTSWREKALQWKWAERAAAWDQSLIDAQQEEWMERRERWRKEEWELAEKLRQKALEMMVFPVAKVTREEDGKITIIEPADWKFGDLPKIVDVASKLARLSTGLATERKESVEWNPDDFTEDELAIIIETGDVQKVIARRGQGQGTSSTSVEEEGPKLLVAE